MLNKKRVTPIVMCCLFLMLAMIPVLLQGVEVKKVEVNRFADFQQGQFKGTALDSKGKLFIGPRVKEIPGPGQEYFLALDTAANGDIYVGTGHQAAVFRIKPESGLQAESLVVAPGTLPDNIEKIFESDEELDVYAVVVSKTGSSSETVYAATSPEGKIYKLTRDKGKKVFFDPDEKFIWDLKEDKDGNIICAVGNSGGIYLITPSGQGAQIFASEDSHIVSLFVTRSNSILAGSGDRGILYRIDNRKVKVLFDSPFEEIRGICEDNEGNIYFSASKDLSLTSQFKLQHATEVSSFLKKKEKEKEEIKTLEKSVLYCLHTNGIVEKIWTSETEYIYSACYDEKNNAVVIGTGDSGRVYRVKKDGSFAIIYESDSAQVFKIAGKNKGSSSGFTLIANNTSAVAQMEDTLNNKGIYFSDIYDLQIQSRLGRLYWEAETGPQTDVQLFIRTGNSNVPDNTWTQWSAPYSDSENSPLKIQDCRYFQLKVLLNSKNAIESPYLDRFRIFYIQSNLGPQIKRIEIKKPLPRATVEITVLGDKTSTTSQKSKDTNYLTVAWEARDLNKDKLKYNIYLKRDNGQNWILIKEDLTENKLRLETRLYQDGKYVLRVEADDSLSNPPSISKTNTLDSSPFLIDSTAPVVSDVLISGSNIRFTVEDKTSLIARVLYSFDGKLWYPAFPEDMINDSRIEHYNFNLNKLPSKKFIFLKVMDEFNNAKVFQEEF
jgi:sugar lactone lactonase YvrE